MTKPLVGNRWAEWREFVLAAAALGKIRMECDDEGTPRKDLDGEVEERFDRAYRAMRESARGIPQCQVTPFPSRSGKGRRAKWRRTSRVS